jgi:hypothetical protein
MVDCSYCLSKTSLKVNHTSRTQSNERKMFCTCVQRDPQCGDFGPHYVLKTESSIL